MVEHLLKSITERKLQVNILGGKIEVIFLSPW
jgi:hypothetical protein